MNTPVWVVVYRNSDPPVIESIWAAQESADHRAGLLTEIGGEAWSVIEWRMADKNITGEKEQ